MTASRLVALTLGELRRTSETSDLDTPARAATVSRVGFRAVWPAAATWPSSVSIGALQPYEYGEIVSTTPDAMKPGFQCVRTPSIRGFMAFAGGPVGAHGQAARAGRLA